MKSAVWVLSTCSPEEGEPCRPQIFADAAAARAAFDANMREEWKSTAPEKEQGTPLDHPGTPEKAGVPDPGGRGTGVGRVGADPA
jgi:hypothetical protein